jgi:RimJ/RimL family protein N-acetyltransferase
MVCAMTDPLASCVPCLGDTVVHLDALLDADVPAHLTGEDDASVRWLTEGHVSTAASTRAWIERSLAGWAGTGSSSQRPLALRDAATGALAGMVEYNLDRAGLGLEAGEVNVSYQVYPQFRGRGFAVRAVNLIVEHLIGEPGVRVLVLRVEDGNEASMRVAARAGFVAHLL